MRLPVAWLSLSTIPNSPVQLQKLADGATADDISEGDHKFAEAAVIVATSFETMSLLVFRKITPFELVMDMAGACAPPCTASLPDG